MQPVRKGNMLKYMIQITHDSLSSLTGNIDPLHAEYCFYGVPGKSKSAHAYVFVSCMHIHLKHTYS